jgi:NADPH:quinone reductase-like Zn-dependent oxidoreductase
MKAVGLSTYGPPEVLRPLVLTVPEPGSDEVLVRVRATSVNPLDCQVRAKTSFVRAKTGFPRVLGFDVSGVVTQVGAAVRLFKPGDEVFGLVDYRVDGADAEYVRVREAFLHIKPPSLTHEEAAAVPLAALTALQALRLKGRMKAGDRVLIVGATGGVGHFAVQVAKAYGAEVAALCRGPQADFVRGLGAATVFALDAGGVPAGERFDLIFDTVGAWSWAAAKGHLKRKGRYVSTHRDIPGLFKARLGRLVGIRERCLWFVVLPDPHGLKYLYDLIEGGRLRPVVQKVYALEDLVQAHRESEAGHVVGKLVVAVPEGREAEAGKAMAEPAGP